MNPLQKLIPLAAVALAISACGGADSASDSATNPGAQSVAVVVEPPAATVGLGGTTSFAAAVTGTAQTGVVWSVVEQGGGSVDANGSYRAPAGPGTFHVRATSVADATRFGESVVTVRASVAVAISPQTPSVVAGGSVTFTATVTGATSSAVTWSVPGTGCGTVTQAGVYTAPSSARTCSVVATSQADSSASATATVTVTAPPPPVLVSVTPATTSVVAGGSVTFSATVTNAASSAVTWSVPGTGCGTVTQAGVYTAPSTARTCSVVATSQASPSASATATVTVTSPPAPVVVSITPASGAVDACRTLTLSARVTGSTDGSVTWSVEEGAVGGSVTTAGVYTAPADPGIYHVVATSRASPTSRAVAAVTVSDRVLSVTVTPGQTSVQTGGTSQFTAVVATTCGSFTSSATVTPSGALTVQ
jgi:hypothetical protein